MRKKRLKYVAINIDNILKPKEERRKSTELKEEMIEESRELKKMSKYESDEEEYSDDESDHENYLILRSSRNRKKISYQFKEYDDLINSAIRDDDYEDYGGHPVSKGKDMATIENALKNQEDEDFGTGPQKTSTYFKHEDESLVKSEEKKQEDEEEQGKGEEEKEYESEDFTHKKNRKKNTARKRRLNDLDSPSDYEDSDESFKEESETEVEDVSAEESLEDESSGDEESTESDWSLRRAKSSRQGRRIVRAGESRGKFKGSKKGYKRDGFVVDSDDDGYGPRSRLRTRAAAKKKVSYKEISSEDEEEEEEDWGWKSKRKKSKSSADTSDDEWEGEDDDGKRKKKKSWVLDDNDEDEEDEEDEEEEEEDEEEEEEEGEEEQSGESEEERVKGKKSGMRGKPRLSKARLMSLKEDSEESDEDKANKKSKMSKLADKDASSTENKQSIEQVEIKSDASVKDERSETEKNNPLLNKALSTSLSSLSAVNPAQENVNIENKSLPSSMFSPNQWPSNAKMAMPAIIPASNIPNVFASNESSPLSQLTAFAAKGSITNAPSSLPQPVSSNFGTYSPNHPHSHSHPKPPPPPLPPSTLATYSSNKDIGDSYSVTSLDSYLNQPKSKTTIINEPYFSHSMNSRLLTPESANFSRQPGPSHPLQPLHERFQPPLSVPNPMNNFDSKKGTYSRLQVPFSEQFDTRPPFLPNFHSHPRNYYDPSFISGNHISNPPHPSHPAHPQTPHPGHPHSSHAPPPLPPHQTHLQSTRPTHSSHPHLQTHPTLPSHPTTHLSSHHQLPSHPVQPHSTPSHNQPPISTPGLHSARPLANPISYRQPSGVMNYPPAGPNNFFHQTPPGYYARGPQPPNLTPHVPASPTERPTLTPTSNNYGDPLPSPPPYASGQPLPPGPYNPYYSHPGEMMPNGGFMIQNLLQSRINGGSDNAQSTTAARSGNQSGDQASSVYNPTESGEGLRMEIGPVVSSATSKIN